jgi:hypothetical protein
MHQYFGRTSFVLAHRNGPDGKPEAWWLEDVDERPCPMPAHWRHQPLQAGETTEEVAEFPTLARLWRAWAAAQHRFAREARCIELIKERMANASVEEKAEVERWVALDGEPFDWDGQKVVNIDGTRWPWSAIRWFDGEMKGVGWPWSTIPEATADGLEIQRREGWADDALMLQWFDLRYPLFYFTAVRAVLDDEPHILVGGGSIEEVEDAEDRGEADDKEETNGNGASFDAGWGDLENGAHTVH